MSAFVYNYNGYSFMGDSSSLNRSAIEVGDCLEFKYNGEKRYYYVHSFDRAQMGYVGNVKSINARVCVFAGEQKELRISERRQMFIYMDILTEIENKGKYRNLGPIKDLEKNHPEVYI